MEANVLMKILEMVYSSGDSVVDGPEEVSIMKKLVEKVHHYKISRTKDGRWITRVPDPSRKDGRRQVRKSSEKELYLYLLDFYGTPQENVKPSMTFEELFTEWIRYKKRYIGACNRKKSISPSTIRRYERDYENYIKGTAFSQKPIGKINAIMIEEFITDMIREHSLKEKAASNTIGYICQAFDYAYRADYIPKDPTDRLDRQLMLSTCPFSAPKENGERVLSKGEMGELKDAVKAHEHMYPDYMPDYAVELAMLTGMRVGEIAALRWSCVKEDELGVEYSEHRLDYSDKPSELIIGLPKNGKIRHIPMTGDMAALFQRIRCLGHESTDGFVFVKKDGSRCTGHDIGCCVSRRGKEAGIGSSVSIHQIRRTVSSLLRESLPAAAVASMLGHNESTNTRFYAYDASEQKVRRDALEKIGRVLPFKRPA